MVDHFFLSSLRASSNLKQLSMPWNEALPDTNSAQSFYENYEPKEILGRSGTNLLSGVLAS